MYKSEVIYQDSIAEFIWYPEIKALLHNYKESSFDATEDEFFNHIVKLGEVIKETRPIGLVQNYKTLKFVVSPEMQIKIVSYIKPIMVESGIIRYAKLIPDDVIAKLMSEQIVEAGRKVMSVVIPDRVFYDLDEALEWIKIASEGKN